MTSIRKSIAAACLGVALAAALSFGATELYANVANDSQDCTQSVCPLEKQAAVTCPLDKPVSCPASAAGA